MHNGMISYEGLTEQDFSLPELPQPYLPGSRNRNPLLYLGYSVLEEKAGVITLPVNMQVYSKQFNACELGASFEEILSEEKIRKLYKSVDVTDFKFCPLFYKGITHVGKIDSPKLGLSSDFITRMKSFGDRLGSSLLQLPESCSLENKDGLFRYLQALPGLLDVSVELTNMDWFINPEQFGLVVEKMHQLNKGLVISDSPGRREAVHMQLSNATAFIRFYGEGWNELDLHRISQWKKQLQSWYLQGLEKCYFFLHIQNKEGQEDFINYVQEELKF